MFPREIQSGKQLRQRGAGDARFAGARGAAIWWIQIDVENADPKLTAQQKEILCEFREDRNRRRNARNPAAFFDKVKGVWDELTE